MKNFIPKKQEKEVISVRMDSSLIEKIDEISAKFDLSRNEFINQCIVFAIEQMKADN